MRNLNRKVGMRINKNLAYRSILTGLLAISALLTQSVVEIFPQEFWDRLANGLYRGLLALESAPGSESGRSLKDPVLDSPGEAYQGGSQVMIVEIGEKSKRDLGGRVTSNHYSQFFYKLKSIGSPIVLANYSISESLPLLSDSKRSRREVSREKKMLDKIKKYQKLIVSGVGFTDKEMTYDEQTEDELDRIGKAILAKRAGTDLKLEDSSLRLQNLESDSIFASAMATGHEAYLSDISSNCLYPYVEVSSGNTMVPSAATWAVTHHLVASFSTWNNARWPRAKELRKTLRRNLRLAPAHCFKSPSVSSVDYVKERGVQVKEFSEIIQWVDLAESETPTLAQMMAGKIIILSAQADANIAESMPSKSRFTRASTFDVARFVDEIIEERSIKRYSLSMYKPFSWLPIAIFLALLVIFLFANLNQMIFFNFVSLCGLLVFSYLQLKFNDEFAIPVNGISFVLLSTVFCLIYKFIYEIFARKRLKVFEKRLRTELSSAFDLEDLQIAAQKICASDFRVFKLFFIGYDHELYEAAKNLDLTEKYLDKISLNHSNLEKALNDHKLQEDDLQQFSTVITSIRKLPKRDAPTLGERVINAKLAITSGGERLGTADLHFTFQAFEENVIPRLLEVLRYELGFQWNLVSIVSKRRLTEFNRVADKVQKNLVKRFLCKSILNKFSPGNNVSQNLKNALKPQLRHVAILQADIRGLNFTTDNEDSKKLLETLKHYYRNVVESAQKIAQVKLIGDSIFLFVEDDPGIRSEVSVADLALHFGGLLVRESERLNESRPGETRLNFSIAIHCGNVIVGNLSSDQSIDYTAVGENVSLVTKLQDINKIPRLNESLGINAILLTQEAKAKLRFFSTEDLGELDLRAANVRVRSFPDIQIVHFATRSNAIKIANKATLKRMTNPRLPLYD